MKGMTSREHQEKFDPKQTCLDYVPRYNLKEERSSSYSFSELVPRKLKVKQSLCANEHNYSVEDYDLNTSQVMKKVPKVHVGNMVSRHKAQVV